MSPDTTKCVECKNNNKYNTCANRRDVTLKCDYFDPKEETKECNHVFDKYGICKLCTITVGYIDPLIREVKVEIETVDWKAKYKAEKKNRDKEIGWLKQLREDFHHQGINHNLNISKLKEENLKLRDYIIDHLILKEQADE